MKSAYFFSKWLVLVVRNFRSKPAARNGIARGGMYFRQQGRSMVNRTDNSERGIQYGANRVFLDDGWTDFYELFASFLNSGRRKRQQHAFSAVFLRVQPNTSLEMLLLLLTYNIIQSSGGTVQFNSIQPNLC
jgi:hypothetical protein